MRACVRACVLSGQGRDQGVFKYSFSSRNIDDRASDRI